MYNSTREYINSPVTSPRFQAEKSGKLLGDVQSAQNHIDRDDDSENDHEHDSDVADNLLRGMGAAVAALGEIPFRTCKPEGVGFALPITC